MLRSGTGHPQMKRETRDEVRCALRLLIQEAKR